MARRTETPVASLPTQFEIGRHLVKVSMVMEGRWVVAVDEGPVPGSYRNQAEAWEAGVREADRIDRAGT
ncbi:MAG TPA: hypothetical protein VMT17_05095 [Anaeromyxobacteraceae bacterium]|nr:hypothetical protein [Anaeromyxobacteraceae bacterium]